MAATGSGSSTTARRRRNDNKTGAEDDGDADTGTDDVALAGNDGGRSAAPLGVLRRSSAAPVRRGATGAVDGDDDSCVLISIIVCLSVIVLYLALQEGSVGIMPESLTAFLPPMFYPSTTPPPPPPRRDDSDGSDGGKTALRRSEARSSGASVCACDAEVEKMGVEMAYTTKQYRNLVQEYAALLAKHSALEIAAAAAATPASTDDDTHMLTEDSDAALHHTSAAVSPSDIVCGVITTRKNHATKARAVASTWGRRCGALVFIDAVDGPSDLNFHVLPGSEEGHTINKKVFGMFEHVLAAYPDKKWFVKADDDVYLQLDNLAALLSNYDHERHHYIGRAGEWQGIRYCGGGASYAISVGLLRDFAPVIPTCKHHRIGEDLSVGLCLRDKLNVTPNFRTGFYHQPPDFFLLREQGRRDHPEGLSLRPFSFHYVRPERMVELEYLLYEVSSHHVAADDDAYVAANPFFAHSYWPPSSPTH